MPNLDQTGPLGQGPMTGRRMGRCTNYGAYKQNTSFNNDQNENLPDDFQKQNYLKGYGRALGLRRGLGFGRGRRGRGRGMGRQNRFRGNY